MARPSVGGGRRLTPPHGPTVPKKVPKSLGFDFPEFAGPPPGSYDPGIKAQVEQAQAGLLDLIEEQERKAHREGIDSRQTNRLLHRNLAQGLQDTRRSREYARADAANNETGYRTSFERDLQDLSTARQQGGEDYEKALTQMQQKYANQASVQAQSRVSTGTNEAGTTAASQAVDAANQAYDKGGVDQAHQRDEAALDTREGRDKENLTRQLDLTQEGLGRQLVEAAIRGHRLRQDTKAKKAQVALGVHRNTADRATELSRATREELSYQQHEAEQAYYQAHQNNPKIIFPSEANAPTPSRPRVPKPSIAPAVAAPVPAVTRNAPLGAPTNHQPHVANPVALTAHRTPGRSYPLGVGRRPYTRF